MLECPLPCTIFSSTACIDFNPFTFKPYSTRVATLQRSSLYSFPFFLLRALLAALSQLAASCFHYVYSLFVLSGKVTAEEVSCCCDVLVSLECVAGDYQRAGGLLNTNDQ